MQVFHIVPAIKNVVEVKKASDLKNHVTFDF